MKMIPTPVKAFAESVGIPVYQPLTLKDGAFLPELTALDPELIIVAAYGRILPSYILGYPKHGCINAHGSLLPKYRGAAPIQRAIIDGETETGITAMYMAEGLDTGDMILKLSTPITDGDNFESLHDRLAILGGEAMCAVIDCINGGAVPREAQNDADATYAAKILKEDTYVDFTRPAAELFNQIRGLSPVPLAVTHTPDGKLLKLTSAEKTDAVSDAAPGTVISLDGGVITVTCGEGCLAITGVVPEGKSRMAASAYINGRKIAVGDVLK
jgi:methionyl-tRNA formyltransferase